MFNLEEDTVLWCIAVGEAAEGENLPHHHAERPNVTSSHHLLAELIVRRDSVTIPKLPGWTSGRESIDCRELDDDALQHKPQ